MYKMARGLESYDTTTAHIPPDLSASRLGRLVLVVVVDVAVPAVMGDVSFGRLIPVI
jgi:hypothetical protein